MLKMFHWFTWNLWTMENKRLVHRLNGFFMVPNFSKFTNYPSAEKIIIMSVQKLLSFPINFQGNDPDRLATKSALERLNHYEGLKINWKIFINLNYQKQSAEFLQKTQRYGKTILDFVIENYNLVVLNHVQTYFIKYDLMKVIKS